MVGGGLVDEVHLPPQKRLAVSGADGTKSGPTISAAHEHKGRDLTPPGLFTHLSGC